MMRKINCIILDDEPLAVRLLDDYASKNSQLQVRYAGSDVYLAMDILKAEQIDLVFLDIQMPELTGIEFMELHGKKTNFIITSAYHEYALDSFRFQVIDFLLKPITFSRFHLSIDKFVTWRDSFSNAAFDDSLFVKSDRKYYKITFDSIIYIEGMKDYIRIHTQEEKIIVLENMKDILEKLPQKQFIRIHRSYIINLTKIKVIDGIRVKTVTDEYLPIGETYRGLIQEWIIGK